MSAPSHTAATGEFAVSGLVTTTFTPLADAYVKSTESSKNFGAEDEIRVRVASTIYRSYLKFNVVGLSGSVQSAKLRLYVTNDGPDGGSLYAVSNNYSTSSAPWQENGITWDNGPAMSSPALAATGPIVMDTWVERDITAGITGNGVYSFGLKNNSSNRQYYSSKEGKNPPQLVIVTTAGGNQPPVTVNDAATVDEDKPIVIPVTANDSDPDGSVDPATVTIVDSPKNGTIVAINPSNGSVTYQSHLNYYGSDTFTYFVKDNTGAASNVATVSITIIAVNDPPVAVDDAVTTDQNTSVTIMVLANDSDPENDLNPAAITIVSPPANGTITAINASNGAVTYAPNGSFAGSDAFTYKVSDQGGATSNTATVAITVRGGGPSTLTLTPVADAYVKSTEPTSNFGADKELRVRDASTDYYTFLKFQATGITGNVQSVKLRLYVVNDGPDGGDVYVASNNYRNTSTPWQENGITWNNAPAITGSVLRDIGPLIIKNWVEIDLTGAINGNGVFSFGLLPNISNRTYYSSREGGDAPQLVISVSGGAGNNQPPVASNDAAITDEGTPVTIHVLANDADSDGSLDPATVASASPPAHGAIVNINTATGAVSYQPNAGFAGSDSFTYTVKDQQGANSNVATVTITVTAVSSLQVTSVSVTPDTVSKVASYTIAIQLGSHGGLIAGDEPITVTWPANTALPATIATANVKVNGRSAASVLMNSAERQVVITSPVDLDDGANVTLAIASGAGIVNPTTAGSYMLQVYTSEEPSPVISPAYKIAASASLPPPAPGTGAAVANTLGDFEKPNQSRGFYHAGAWWLVALRASPRAWVLWKHVDGNWVDQGVVISSARKDRPDCVVDSPNNKLYVYYADSKSGKIMRLTYNNGAWHLDSGFPRTASTVIITDGESTPSFTRANNGELWAFQIVSGALMGILSSDNGVNWSAAVTLKSNLNNSTGLTDCAPFVSVGVNYVGVCYAENTAPQAIFGFLKHADGGAGSAWSDETSQLTPTPGTEADDHLNMAVAGDGTVYIVTKTDGGGKSVIANGLYKRSPGGGWQLFAVNRGSGWTRPALIIDESNNRLYAFGTLEGGVKYGQFKLITRGNESQLEFSSTANVFQNGSDNFVNLSVPHHNAFDHTGMMVTVQNDTKSQTWYNLMALTAGSTLIAAQDNTLARTPETVPPIKALEASDAVGVDLAAAIAEGVQVYPNPFNPATTIRYAVAEPAAVQLHIFNIRGELIRKLLHSDVPAGIHEARWNGRDRSGQPVASGIYYYRLTIGNQVLFGSMQMIK